MGRHTHGGHPQRRLGRDHNNLRCRHLRRLSSNNLNNSNNNNIINNINNNSSSSSSSNHNKIISISNINKDFTLATPALMAIREWLPVRWQCSRCLRCRLGEDRLLRHPRHL